MNRLPDGSIDTFKARLIAEGFTQSPSVDFNETYATIVHVDSLQLLLAITAVHGWCHQQVDDTSAFHYSNLEEEIYMTLADGRREKGKPT
jgi:hypothetical protein